MVIPASDQDKRNMSIALLNHELHADSICPGNHEVSYNRGWFQIDDNKPFRRPDITANAERLLRAGEVVYYSPVWNTYVIAG